MKLAPTLLALTLTACATRQAIHPTPETTLGFETEHYRIEIKPGNVTEGYFIATAKSQSQLPYRIKATLSNDSQITSAMFFYENGQGCSVVGKELAPCTPGDIMAFGPAVLEIRNGFREYVKKLK